MPAPEVDPSPPDRSQTGAVRVPEKLFGIVGGSLDHSLSPILHNWGFAREGLPFTYHAWEISRDDIPAFSLAVRTLPIAGLSVTIPHKQALIPYLDGLTAEAEATGAVNTLFWEEGALQGDNTDCQGFMAPLLQAGSRPASALVLGAGGAAMACVRGLLGLPGCEVAVTARNSEKAQSLAGRFGVQALPWDQRDGARADLVVNATPLGTAGKLERESPLPAESLDRFSTVYDLVYNPAETTLLKKATAAFCRTIGGLEMFLHQGLLQFERWTGRRLPESESRKILQEGLQSMRRGTRS